MSSTTPASSWLSLIFPPERLEPLEIRLSDNSVRRAVWTGAKWWSDGREVQPEAWRPLQPELQQAAG
ncbi:MAG: hypothetical protein ACREIA_24185 [Opitutaceae bacterium]